MTRSPHDPIPPPLGTPDMRPVENAAGFYAPEYRHPLPFQREVPSRHVPLDQRQAIATVGLVVPDGQPHAPNLDVPTVLRKRDEPRLQHATDVIREALDGAIAGLPSDHALAGQIATALRKAGLL